VHIQARLTALMVGSVALGTVTMAGPAGAQQSLAEYVAQSCKAELESYCSQVTPGQSRLLACVYAHGDKLSGQCESALYDAAVALERAIGAISYVAGECRADIESLCAGVQAGEGRIAQCLADNEAKLSARCTEAFKEVGVE
jgi:hypothetical protein